MGRHLVRLLFISCLTSHLALAEDKGLIAKNIQIDGENDPSQIHVPTITRLNGKVELLSNPSDKVIGTDPHAKFDGKYYSFRSARVGDRVGNGDILRVSSEPEARARMIFNNGDHVDVASGTAYRLA